MTEKNTEISIDVPDVDENADRTDTDNEKSPIPKAVLVGLPAVIIFLLVGGYYLVTSFLLSKTDKHNQKIMPAKTLQVEKVLHSIRPAVAKSLPSEKIKNTTAIKNIHKSVDKLNEKILTADDRINNLSQSLSGIKNKLDTKIPKVTANNKNITALKNKIDVLGVSVSGLAEKLAGINRKIAALHHRDHLSHRPPFMLLSIDQWGNTNSAVLEINGKTSLATVGDIRAGWTVASFNMPNCITVIQLHSHRHVRICRTGER